jgi:hypothetical protein
MMRERSQVVEEIASFTSRRISIIGWRDNGNENSAGLKLYNI